MFHRILLLMSLLGFGMCYSEIDIINDCYENLGNIHNNSEDSQLLSTIYDVPEEPTVDPGTPEHSDTTSSDHLVSSSTSTVKPRTQPSTASATRTTTVAASDHPLSSSEVQNTPSSTSPLKQHTRTSSELAPTTDTSATRPISPTTSAISTSDQPPKTSPTAEPLVPSTSSSTSKPPTKNSNTHSTTSSASLPEPTSTPTTTTPKPAENIQCSDTKDKEKGARTRASFLKGRRSGGPKKSMKSRSTKPGAANRPTTTTKSPIPAREAGSTQRNTKKTEETRCSHTSDDEDDDSQKCDDQIRDFVNFCAIAVIVVVTAYFMN